MPDKYDVRDRYGNKLGEIRPQTDVDMAVGNAGASVGLIIFLVILFLPLAVLYFLVKWGVKYPAFGVLLFCVLIGSVFWVFLTF
jgi:hypothetical protein